MFRLPPYTTVYSPVRGWRYSITSRRLLLHYWIRTIPALNTCRRKPFHNSCGGGYERRPDCEIYLREMRLWGRFAKYKRFTVLLESLLYIQWKANKVTTYLYTYTFVCACACVIVANFPEVDAGQLTTPPNLPTTPTYLAGKFHVCGCHASH